VTYVLRLPRATLVALAILAGAVGFGLLLAVNAFYFALTSASNQEAFDRIDAAAERMQRSWR
jgi:hypothetical protein